MRAQFGAKVSETVNVAHSSYSLQVSVGCAEGDRMKTTLVCAVLLFASCASAQGQGAAAAPVPQVNPAMPGCGPANEKFKVTTDPKPQEDPAPEAGKALIYFVQDDRFFTSHPRPTVKWGVDGAWVGATRSATYFHIWVEPGAHHLCSEWQSAVILTQDAQVAVAHFTAEAGKTYYFRAQNVYWKEMPEAAVTLDPIDSDEGALLASRAGYSNATLKK
jgi:hypothetical protein